MVEFFGIFYAVMQVIAVLMAWPQIRKLYLTKDSAGLSLTTWTTWLASSFVTISYAYLTEQIVWMSANIGWAVFYGAMVVLIIRYREQTIYQQTVELFRMRFYFSIKRSKVKAEADDQPHSFFAKFRRGNSDTSDDS